MMDLREHQVAALDALRHSLATHHRRPMLQMATGGGKTLLAAAIIGRAYDKGNRATFVVPALSLIDQTWQRFAAAGIHPRLMGVIQSDHPATDAMRPIQIASVQTLARRQFPSCELVVVDEAHIAHRTIFRWMADRPELPFVGLSATPWTSGLGRHYDDLIVGATTADLIAKGFLSPFRVYAPSHPDLSGVSTVAGDYHEGQLADAMGQPDIVADVVKTWLELGENRPTLCFGVNRAHARKLQDEFEAAGVPTSYVDAFTEREGREAVREAFADGRIKVVCNVGVLTTGVDWDVRCLILARPTKSEILYVQIVGRALRTAPGKADAIILDHGDTALRLGLPTDIQHDRLSAGRESLSGSRSREAAPKLPKECPKCHYVKPAGIHICPSCGFAPERQSDVVVGDGSLVLVSGKERRVDTATKQRFFSGLLWYCEQRGYRPGWASNQYRQKFGVWPANTLMHRSMPPAPEVRSWVTASMIRYRATQERARA
jgi:superfamily II DNA or RNA helicase